jgi:hypothetical protein
MSTGTGFTSLICFLGFATTIAVIFLAVAIRIVPGEKRLRAYRLGKAGLLLAWIALAGCRSTAPAVTQPLASRTPEPGATLQAGQTLTAETATPSPSPAASLAPGGALDPEGPWFLYAPSWNALILGPGCWDCTTPDPTIYLTNPDGSGRTALEGVFFDDDIERFSAFADPANRLAILSGVVYVVRPGQEQAYIINEPPSRLWHDSFISGDGRSGLLASVEGQPPDAMPELVIHQLPGLEVRSRIPLIVCPQDAPDCQVGIYERAEANMWPRNPVGERQQLSWSPDGRYLAFAAIRLGSSSDLYVYDSTDGSTQDMTAGPEDIGQIWWSPDGSWIVFESLSELQETLWAITLDGRQARQLYAAERFGPGLGISGWVSNDTFLTQEGLWEVDFLRNLRLADLGTGQVTTLYPDEFRHMDFERNTGAFILLFLPNEEGGWYWLTAADPTPRKVQNQQGDYHWDDALQTFVFSAFAEAPCAAGQYAAWIPDVIRCRPRPAPVAKPDLKPSPDGQWQVRIADGIWLESNAGLQLGRVGSWTSGQIIWRPDSLGFFVVADRALYYVSVPDLALTLVDDGVGDRIGSQWLGSDGH